MHCGKNSDDAAGVQVSGFEDSFHDAENSGIERGMRILSVNGEDVSTHSKTATIAIVKAAGRPLTMEFSEKKKLVNGLKAVAMLRLKPLEVDAKQAPSEQQTQASDEWDQNRLKWVFNVVKTKLRYSSSTQHLSSMVAVWHQNMELEKRRTQSADDVRAIFRNHASTAWDEETAAGSVRPEGAPEVPPKREGAAAVVQAGLRGRQARVECLELLGEGYRTNTPDPKKVAQIVASLRRDTQGRVTVAAVEGLFVDLLGVTASALQQNQDEVLAFAGLSEAEMGEQLGMGLTVEKVEEHHALVAPGSLLERQKPDRRKVARILESAGGDIPCLFVELLELPPNEVSSDHPDVIFFESLGVEEQVDQLRQAATGEQVEAYFAREWRLITSSPPSSPKSSKTSRR